MIDIVMMRSTARSALARILTSVCSLLRPHDRFQSISTTSGNITAQNRVALNMPAGKSLVLTTVFAPGQANGADCSDIQAAYTELLESTTY